MFEKNTKKNHPSRPNFKMMQKCRYPLNVNCIELDAAICSAWLKFTQDLNQARKNVVFLLHVILELVFIRN